MTYENLVKAAKKAMKAVDASGVKEHLAVEFDVYGNVEGAFYVEFKENEVNVEPYEYYDHDFRVRGEADTLLAILNGELSPVTANTDCKIYVEGNWRKLELLENYLKPEVVEKKTSAEKKPAEKKSAAKKTAAKKTVKAAEVKAEEPAKAEKTAAKAAKAEKAEKKPVPKKVTKKPAAKKN